MSLRSIFTLGYERYAPLGLIAVSSFLPILNTLPPARKEGAKRKPPPHPEQLPCEAEAAESTAGAVATDSRAMWQLPYFKPFLENE